MKLLDLEASHDWFELVSLIMRVGLRWTLVWPRTSLGLLQVSP
jgi:hypothetical protein